MIVLMGYTASGKDTILNHLVSKYGFKKIIPYTSRPMRDGEIQDKTYHYLSKEAFKEKINQEFFAEYKSYNTVFGTWYYGSAKEDYERNDCKSIVVLAPSSYMDIIKSLGYKPKSIYIQSSEETIIDRLNKRGDNKDEAERRIASDRRDFAGIQTIADLTITNDNGMSVDNIAKLIMNFLKGVLNEN